MTISHVSTEKRTLKFEQDWMDYILFKRMQHSNSNVQGGAKVFICAALILHTINNLYEYSRLWLLQFLESSS